MIPVEKPAGRPFSGCFHGTGAARGVGPLQGCESWTIAAEGALKIRRFRCALPR
jgi:hypothetical protein